MKGENDLNDAWIGNGIISEFRIHGRPRIGSKLDTSMHDLNTPNFVSNERVMHDTVKTDCDIQSNNSYHEKTNWVSVLLTVTMIILIEYIVFKWSGVSKPHNSTIHQHVRGTVVGGLGCSFDSSTFSCNENCFMKVMSLYGQKKLICLPCPTGKSRGVVCIR